MPRKKKPTPEERAAALEAAFLSDTNSDEFSPMSNAEKWQVIKESLGSKYGDNLTLFRRYDYSKAYETAELEELGAYTFLIDLQGQFLCVLVDEGLLDGENIETLIAYETSWYYYMKLTDKYVAISNNKKVFHHWLH